MNTKSIYEMLISEQCEDVKLGIGLVSSLEENEKILIHSYLTKNFVHHKWLNDGRYWWRHKRVFMKILL